MKLNKQHVLLGTTSGTTVALATLYGLSQTKEEKKPETTVLDNSKKELADSNEKLRGENLGLTNRNSELEAEIEKIRNGAAVQKMADDIRTANEFREKLLLRNKNAIEKMKADRRIAMEVRRKLRLKSKAKKFEDRSIKLRSVLEDITKEYKEIVN